LGLRHLPGKQKNSVCGELLHASRHIDDIQVVRGIDRHRTWFVELPNADAARSDDLDRVKNSAVKVYFVVRRCAGDLQEQAETREKEQGAPCEAPARTYQSTPGVRRRCHQSPDQQWCKRHAQQREAKRVYLGIMAIMQQVKNSQRQGFSAGRDNQNHRFGIPQAEQEQDIPGRKNRPGNLGPPGMAQHLPTRGAFQPGHITEVRINSPQREGRRVPADHPVANDKRQNDDTSALIKKRGPPVVESVYQADA
jgi:hypothetical protein